MSRAFSARRGGAAASSAGAAMVPARLVADQLFEAGDVLSRACADDPMFTYLLPDKMKRPRRLPRLARAFVRYGYAFGEVYVTPPPINGVAIWLPPPHNRLRLTGLLRLGLIAPLGELDLGTILRLMRSARHVERARRRAASSFRAAGYLLALGAIPSPRHASVERALLQVVLERADAAGFACCAESTRAQLVLVYVEHGFRAITEGDLPGNGPRFWSLCRESA